MLLEKIAPYYFPVKQFSNETTAQKKKLGIKIKLWENCTL